MLISLRDVFTQDVPLLDVRAPVEFAQGSFPTAYNLPIMNDTERESVGICYKNEGPQAAQQLGYQLVSGAVKQARLSSWIDFVNADPRTLLYCFRGGLRSQIAERWLRDAGFPVQRIDGGYKAMRNFLLQVYDDLPPITIISGRTGTGKTEIIQRLDQAVDLERRANHRGSAFGRKPGGQPAQIDFENAVAIDILKCDGPIILEDESRLIGRVNLPLPLQAAMKVAPVVLLEDPLPRRVQRIYQEYIVEQGLQLRAVEHSGEDANQAHKLMFLEAVDAIRKRLGGVGHLRIRSLVESAFDCQDEMAHRQWISELLTDYYDPMYDFQLTQKRDRVIFSGDHAGVLAYLQSVSGS